MASTHLPRLSHLGLRAFPPEILELIFKPLLTGWTGQTPPLLIALRADQQLYQEALALFRRLNTFKLHRGNEWKTGSMKDTALRGIRSLTIEFWSSEDWEEWDYSQVIEPNTHSFSTHPILLAQDSRPTLQSDIRSVHMNVATLSEFNMKACLLPAVACAQSLPLLREISVALPRIAYHRSSDEYDMSGLVSDLVDDFNHHLGTRGRLRDVGAMVETGEKMVWFWRAEGEVQSLGECMRRAKTASQAMPPALWGRDDGGCWASVGSAEHQVIERKDVRNIR